MKLAVVIIHYNTSDDLDRCLTSLRHGAPACEHAVMVVDNASTDPGLAGVRERFPDVVWQLNDENVGYSRAVNQGLAALASDYTLILNPDIVIQPGSLDALLACADGHPRAGIVAPQLLNEDGTIQDSCRRFYTLRTMLMRRTMLGKIFRHDRTVDAHLMRDFDHLSLRAVDWVIGGAMLVRREAVVRVGPMDERFFLYFEDVDWCYRMNQAGWDVLYTPDARFVHRHRRDSARGVTHRSFWLHLGSLITFYEKWGMLVWLLKRWRDPLTSLLLWLVDAAALNVAFLGAYALRAAANPWFPEPVYPLAEYRTLQLFATLLMTVTFAFQGRYRTAVSRRPTTVVARLQQVGVLGVLLLASTWLGRQQVVSRAVLLAFLPLFGVAAAAGERLLRHWQGRLERGWFSLERTLLVGRRADVAAWLERRGDPRAVGLDVVGWLHADEESAPSESLRASVPCLGAAAGLGDVVERYRIAQVLWWTWPRGDLRELNLLARLRRRRIRLRWLVPQARLLAAGAHPELEDGEASVVLDPGPARPATAALRRAADVAAGLLLMIATAPLGLLSRLVPGSRRQVPLPAPGEPDGGRPLTVVCDGRGRSRPLPWQAGLARALFGGRLTLVGPTLREVGEDGGSAAAAWDLRSHRPGLIPSRSGPRGRAANFYHDPAGVASFLADAAEEAPR